MCKYVQHTSNIYDTSTQTSNIAATTLVSKVHKQGIQHCQYLCIHYGISAKKITLFCGVHNFFELNFHIMFWMLTTCLYRISTYLELRKLVLESNFFQTE